MIALDLFTLDEEGLEKKALDAGVYPDTYALQERCPRCGVEPGELCLTAKGTVRRVRVMHVVQGPEGEARLPEAELPRELGLFTVVHEGMGDNVHDERYALGYCRFNTIGWAPEPGEAVLVGHVSHLTDSEAVAWERSQCFRGRFVRWKGREALVEHEGFRSVMENGEKKRVAVGLVRTTFEPYSIHKAV